MIRNKIDNFIGNTIKNTIELRQKYPDLFRGIDLSGN